jgi:serine/threonine-protein kinase
LTQYTSERQFNTSPETFCEKLQKALQNNIFEEYIQKNSDVLNSVVSCSYRYDNSVDIPCEAVKAFLTWYESYGAETKDLILQNIISKLSTIAVSIPDDELPF